jgi:hypothetical protein
MKSVCRLTLALALAMAMAWGIHAMPAPASPRHPEYLHALADLRTARAYIANPDSGVMHEQEKNAIDEIDRAIAEIKAAAIDDGKDLNDHPGIDSHLRWIGRLNKAAVLLNKAHDDCAKEEDDAAAQGLQGRALDHIAKARRFVEQAIALEQ